MEAETTDNVNTSDQPEPQAQEQAPMSDELKIKFIEGFAKLTNSMVDIVTRLEMADTAINRIDKRIQNVRRHAQKQAVLEADIA